MSADERPTSAAADSPTEADSPTKADSPTEAPPETDGGGGAPVSPSEDPIVFPPGWEPGAPVPEQWVDEDLAGATSLGRQVDFSRPLLVFLVSAFALWLASQYTLELRYAFSSTEAIELGRAEELRLDPAFHDGLQLNLPSNRYVQLEAVLERRAVADRNHFFKVVGAPIILQQRDERADDARLFRDLPRTPDRNADSFQPTSTTTGRLVAFTDLPPRYQSIARYYSEALAVHYCGVEPSLELQRFLENRRETVRLRMQRELDREPTLEELDARLGRHARCQHAFMFFSDAAPRDFWYFPVLYLIFALMLGGALVVLVRWGRETFGAEG